MISRFELPFEFKQEVEAVNLEKVSLTKTSPLAKLYIPTVMPTIPKGEPAQTPFESNGLSCVKNAINRPSITSQILHEQNYLTASINHDSNPNDTKRVVEEVTSYMHEKLPNIYDARSYSYVLQKDASVRALFLNNKISKLCFTVIKNTNISQSLA